MEWPIAVGPGKPLGEKRVIENGIDREVRAQSSLEVSLVKAVQTAHAARNPLHPERKDRQPVLDEVIDMRVANAAEALIGAPSRAREAEEEREARRIDQLPGHFR